MSTVTIPNLPAAGALTGAELLPVVQNGTTSNTTTQDIANLAGGGAFPYTGSAQITGSLEVIGSVENGSNNIAGGQFESYVISGYTIGVGATVIGNFTSSLTPGVKVVFPLTDFSINEAIISGSNAVGGNTFITASALGSPSLFGFVTNNSTIINTGVVSYAQGQYNSAPGSDSHAEGVLTIASGSGSHAEGYITTAIGNYTHTEGIVTTAIGLGSHAEGYLSRAIGDLSHVEGSGTTAIGGYAHAEGSGTVAIGGYAHAEGFLTTAIGNGSHAEGQQTTAIGFNSHAEGLGTVTNQQYMHATGQYNITGSIVNTSYAYFVVGNGNNVTRSNAFRVSGSGECLAGGTFTNGGADYAEYFESFDGNAISLGTVVELTGSFIKPCTVAENAIGVISNKPSVLGNSDEGTADEWVGKYKKDIWGNYEMVEEEYQEEVGFDEEQNPIYETKTKIVRVLNPNYDPTIAYIPRAERPEWNVVGLVGQIRVLNNQPIPSRWIKMKSVSSEVDLYFVK
jgi:hypothetical protein